MYEFRETVYLNSGSMPLTVLRVTDDGNVTVFWANDDQEIEKMTLPWACFTRIKPADDE